MRVLCVFGKHQYGDPARGTGTEYRAFMPALHRLGHQTVHFESWNPTCRRDYVELNRALLDTVECERPDVMLVVQRNYEIWLETLQIIRARGDVATICWTTDDSWKYREVSRFIGKAYHAMTTTYPEVIPRYHRDGIAHVLLTQWAASAETLQEPLPVTACRYPVSFVGTAYGNRPARLAELLAHGIEVVCFGHGWGNGPVPAEQIPRIIRESIISLNFANSRGRNQIKARTFEVPGAGGFLLTEEAAGLEKYYSPGREIVTFSSMPDFVAKIRYYLAHPVERDAIARAGFERTRRDHTYDSRVQEALDFAQAARDHWLKTSPRLRISGFVEAARRHQMNLALRALRSILVALGSLIWGRQRGRRAARRLVFELSWRLGDRQTFTAAGWPGRMFPEQ